MAKKKVILLIVLMLSLISCMSVAVKHPIIFKKQINQPIKFSITSTAKMNILNKALTEKENNAKFSTNIEYALSDIEKCIEKLLCNSITVQKTSVLTKPKLENFEGNLYLHIELSGYGSLKTKLKKFLILSGMELIGC